MLLMFIFTLSLWTFFAMSSFVAWLMPLYNESYCIMNPTHFGQKHLYYLYYRNTYITDSNPMVTIYMKNLNKFRRRDIPWKVLLQQSAL